MVIFLPRNRNCKIIKHEPDWTPNNYEISFNPSDIPSNIQTESADSLQKKLQKLMPLSTRIHVNLSTGELSEKNDLEIHTCLKVNGKDVNLL